MTKRPFEPAPPDPGVRPGVIRDRAMKAVMARGPVPEDPERTRRSQEYWRKYRAEQKQRADADAQVDAQVETSPPSRRAAS